MKKGIHLSSSSRLYIFKNAVFQSHFNRVLPAKAVGDTYLKEMNLKNVVMKIEDNEKKIKLAEDQGKAYSAALDYMKEMDNHAEKEVEDYIISLASEEAEGTYQLQEGKLKWNTPKEGFNTHLEIVVRDRKDKRFIPGLKIHGKVMDENGKEIVETDFPFLWHPFLLHYGAFFKIPKEGKYKVQLKIPAPEFHRHDEIKGKRYENDIDVEMEIEMEAGREPHGPE